MQKQRTLDNAICATGMGLHTGQKVNLSLRPAAPDTGIVFRRVDLEVPAEIPAVYDNIVEDNISTILGKGGVTVSYVEHILAAFAGMGIDNAFVDVNASEVPAMDGSAGTFVFLIQSAGTRQQDALRKILRVKKTVSVSVDEKKVQLRPSELYRLTCSTTYHHPEKGVNSRKEQIDMSPGAFQSQISRARSFSFARDEKILHNKAPISDGNTEHSGFPDDSRISLDSGLRYENEFLKHKLIDTAGVLSLLGYRLQAEYIGHQTDHLINFQLMRALVADRDAWEIISDNQGDRESNPNVRAVAVV